MLQQDARRLGWIAITLALVGLVGFTLAAIDQIDGPRWSLDSQLIAGLVKVGTWSGIVALPLGIAGVWLLQRASRLPTEAA